MTKTLRCKECGQDKPLTPEHWNFRSHTTKLIQPCRACSRARCRAWRAEPVEDTPYYQVARQDVLEMVGAHPVFTARDLCEGMWETFNYIGLNDLKRLLRKMRDEGLIWARGGRWALSPTSANNVRQ
jgi:hypothetical protein